MGKIHGGKNAVMWYQKVMRSGNILRPEKKKKGTGVIKELGEGAPQRGSPKRNGDLW